MCYCSWLCVLLQVPAVVGFEPTNLGLWVDCSTDELQPLALPCVSHFLTSAAGHEPSTMGWWGACSTNVPLPLSMSSTSSPSRGWIWTCKLRFMSWLFYGWATTTDLAMCFSFSCSSFWTWTLDHGMLRYMFYQGATAIIYAFYSKP